MVIGDSNVSDDVSGWILVVVMKDDKVAKTLMNGVGAD